MFESFRLYWKLRKPSLDEAVREHISGLLKHVPVRRSGELDLALEGGKKLRGILLGMIAEELGGPWTSALQRAVAVELIQAATLIHDDFVDQDRVRRKVSAVWTLEGARRAVLVGDVIFASAIYLMSELGRDDGRVVSRAIAQISRGALMEPSDPILFRDRIASDDWRGGHYEKVIHLKTGVLFEAACELGAISAEADATVRLHCKRYGALIGQSYQMADDVKEIRHHLLTKRIDAVQMAPLAPAVLCFSEDAFPYITPILSGRSADIPGPFRERLQSAADLMEQDIKRRLALAVEEARLVFPVNGKPPIALRAPEEIIAMFNRS